jgi:O-acetyl-ADP-ribose deacetylase (regulator of RNase III)
MIVYKTGDIFTSNAEILVNPVNCKGVMGAGLAKQFRERFPENYLEYKNYCKNGDDEGNRAVPGGWFFCDNVL